MEMVVDVLILSMKNLSLHSKLKEMTGRAVQVSSRDRKVTLATGKLILDFYHETDTPSTITSRPAKLKIF